jgi:site-specific DNA-cytosine methylase
MKRQKVLIINSYAGSLTIAAHARPRRYDVVGSYEDAGYGLDVQRANFPGLDYRETTDAWPRQDLRGVVVLAHPPCAAFSQQNSSNHKIHGKREYRGCGACKFSQTEVVLEYALRNKCDALAVESVVGAYDGAREVHDAYARKHGYHVFRVLQNAATFGVPQWRPRFWALFVRRSLLGTLRLRHVPNQAIIRDVIESCECPIENDSRWYDRQVALLRKAFGDRETNRILDDVGSLHSVLHRRGHDVTPEVVLNARFSSNAMRLLDPNGVATTVLGSSWWVLPMSAGGRPLNAVEFKRIMGYPDTYTFLRLSQLKGLLSRGVVPAVARWVLDQVVANFNGKPQRGATEVPAGATFDIRPRSVKTWLADPTVNPRVVRP